MTNEHDQMDEMPPVNEGRRKLTKAGLAAPAVLGILASRPVLAEAPWNCTVSGQISGNISRPGQVPCSSVGLGRSAYENIPTAWSPCAEFFKTSGNQNNCNQQVNQARDFGDAPGTAGVKFSAAFRMPKNQNQTRPATVWEVFHNSNGLSVDTASYPHATIVLGQEILLALLNYNRDPNGFPINRQDIVAMFNQVAATNAYNTGVLGNKVWSGATVLWYLQSLHP